MPNRAKQRNVDRERRVSVTIMNHENPYSYAFVQGTVVEQHTDGADENIDKLAKKYTGMDKYQNRQQGEKRVMLIIRPEHIVQQ